MKIIGPPLPASIDLLVKSPKSIINAWKIGQLIQATGASNQINGQATINVGSTMLLAKTQFPIKPGQALTLEVTRLLTMAMLKIINKTSSTGSASITSTTISLPPQTNLSNPLQVGQILTAVLSRSTQSGQAILELAGNRISVPVSQPLLLTDKQSIKLEVITPGSLLSLRILTPATGSHYINQAMRIALPLQTPLPPSLANIALIAHSKTPQHMTSSQSLSLALPQALVKSAQHIINNLPTRQSISTGDGLKQAIQQSGLFLEAKLAQTIQNNPVAINAASATSLIDFKGGLLSLLVALFSLTKKLPGTPMPPAKNPVATTPPPMPHKALHAQASAKPTLTQQMNLQQTLSELLRSVEGGLARVQLSQLASSTVEDETRRPWLLELPVRTDGHIDLIQLRIDKQQQENKNNNNPTWTVTLAFDLKGLGSVHVNVSLNNNMISTTFWAESKNTTLLIKDHLKMLTQQFKKAGLEVGTLNAHSGPAPQPDPTGVQQSDFLVDENV